jgi:hypothetical protein
MKVGYAHAPRTSRAALMLSIIPDFAGDDTRDVAMACAKVATALG